MYVDIGNYTVKIPVIGLESTKHSDIRMRRIPFVFLSDCITRLEFVFLSR